MLPVALGCPRAPWLVTHSHRSQVARSPPHSPLRSPARAGGVAVGVAPLASLRRAKGAVLGLWGRGMGPLWGPYTSTVPPRVPQVPMGSPCPCQVLCVPRGSAYPCGTPMSLWGPPCPCEVPCVPTGSACPYGVPYAPKMMILWVPKAGDCPPHPERCQPPPRLVPLPPHLRGSSGWGQTLSGFFLLGGLRGFCCRRMYSTGDRKRAWH